MQRGKLIVFEGINGCGKGTQITKFVHELFKDRTRTFFLTREPNYFDDNGREARRILSSDGDPYQSQLEALRYFSLNRITHNGIFRPMLDLGINAISDRYYDSTFAFQHAQGVSYEEIAKLNRDSRISVPDLTLLIDAPVDVAFERLGKRSDDRRKFDNDYAFMKKVRQNYLDLPNILPGLMDDKSIVIINGEGSVDDVAERIMQEYKTRFDEK